MASRTGALLNPELLGQVVFEQALSRLQLSSDD